MTVTTKYSAFIKLPVATNKELGFNCNSLLQQSTRYVDAINNEILGHEN